MEPVVTNSGHGLPVTTASHHGVEIVFIRENYKCGWAHVTLGSGGHCWSGHTMGRCPTLCDLPHSMEMFGELGKLPGQEETL